VAEITTEVGNSGRGQVCLEGGVQQCSKLIRGTAHRCSQGSSCSKEGSRPLSFLNLHYTHLRHVWTNLFVPYRPVQSQMKPSLRFVASTTHSISCVCKVSFFVFFWSLRHTHRSHQWTNFDHLDASYMTSFHARMCLLGGKFTVIQSGHVLGQILVVLYTADLLSLKE